MKQQKKRLARLRAVSLTPSCALARWKKLAAAFEKTAFLVLNPPGARALERNTQLNPIDGVNWNSNFQLVGVLKKCAAEFYGANFGQEAVQFMFDEFGFACSTHKHAVAGVVAVLDCRVRQQQKTDSVSLGCLKQNC